ncbi:MAG: NUDIX hydrolase [Candidatus Latescibacterota bacterium]|nr:MAG: NUDIX hydrolase [Candidatus Latescibacterota bacterium]
MEEHTGAVHAQSAAIPYRIEGNDLRILLIRNRSDKRWIVPKGIIESWQTPEDAALEEAYEEAGVRGTITGGSVGTYEYRKWGGICQVNVFLLRVENELATWPESDFRRRRWFTVETALEIVDNEGLRRLIARAATRATS